MFRRRKRGWLFRLFFISLFVLLIVAGRFFYSVSYFYDYIFSAVSYPVIWSQKYIVKPLRFAFKKRKSEQDLQEIVFKLHRDKEDLIADNIKLRSSLVYYDQIQELVEFKKRYDFKDFCISKVLFKSINQDSHFFLIDKGARHAIEVGMVAIYKNCIIGRVTSVYPFYSRITLITDRSCKVASICTKTKAVGIHVGDNSTEYSCLNRVSHLSKVVTKDLVISSGEGTVFPQGFALGRIDSVRQNGLFYDVTVKPIIDIDRLDYCFIIKKGADASSRLSS